MFKIRGARKFVRAKIFRFRAARVRENLSARKFIRIRYWKTVDFDRAFSGVSKHGCWGSRKSHTHESGEKGKLLHLMAYGIWEFMGTFLDFMELARILSDFSEFSSGKVNRIFRSFLPPQSGAVYISVLVHESVPTGAL